MTLPWRRAIWLLVATLLASLLAACGSSPSEPGGLEGQVLGLLSPSEQPVLLQGALVAISGPGGDQLARTDDQGKYRFDTLRPGTYGLAASYQGPQAGGKGLQAEERQFTVSPSQDETIGLVLLADGLTPPTTPPPPPPGFQAGSAPVGSYSAGYGGGGLTTDPFFWYFLLNRPTSYGWGRPPIITGGGGRPIVLDQNQPQRSRSDRPYTNYDEGSATGVRTKPLPQVTSKGTTRPGATTSGGGSPPPGGSGSSAARPPSPSAPATRPPSSSGGSAPAAQPASASDSGSKGSTRPGGSAPSVKPPTSKPPASRPPSSGGRRR